MTPEEAVAIALRFPGAEEGRSYSQPVVKVAGKFFTRVRQPSEKDPGAMVVQIGFFERDALMAADPETFFVTPHYKDYPTVLVRLERVDPEMLETLLTESWRVRAPKMLVAAFDAEAESRR